MGAVGAVQWVRCTACGALGAIVCYILQSVGGLHGGITVQPSK